MSNVTNGLALVGHPYAPIGRGEDVRCTYRALRSVALQPALVDIYGLIEPDKDAQREFELFINQKLGKVNVFHINGNEVEQSLQHLKRRRQPGSYNIIYPQWELSCYPGEWASQLDRFDEIWAPSEFVLKSLAAVCKKPVILMPLPTEVMLSSFLGRRYFGIPESDYIFLFFFDLRSYSSRKNPVAVIDAFRCLMAKRQAAQSHLVIKIHGADHAPEMLEKLLSNIQDLRGRVTLINEVMTDNEVKNLVRCCDCFVSLHRSEGYGRGLSEAMFLGKPVIATAYSGNMTFMSSNTALLVPYKLIPVGKDAYPHWQDQVWADPDVEQASDYMTQLLDDPDFGRILGEQASRHIRVEFGYRATGFRYRQRLEEAVRHKTAASCGSKFERV